MDTSFELEGGKMKTNQSNETTLKVISIKIMGLTDTNNKNLARSEKNQLFKPPLSAELKFVLYQLNNRNGLFLHEFKLYKTQKNNNNKGQ